MKVKTYELDTVRSEIEQIEMRIVFALNKLDDLSEREHVQGVLEYAVRQLAFLRKHILKD